MNEKCNICRHDVYLIVDGAEWVYASPISLTEPFSELNSQFQKQVNSFIIDKGKMTTIFCGISPVHTDRVQKSDQMIMVCNSDKYSHLNILYIVHPMSSRHDVEISRLIIIVIVV